MAEVLKEDDENQKDDEIIIVEDEKESKKPQATEVEDEDDDSDDQEDEKVAKTDENEDEREAIRERRRLEKLERKERREKAINRDKIELDFLRKRNDELERRLSGVEQRTHQADLSNIDQQIARAAQEAEMAEKVIAKAVAAGNGDDVAQALRYRDQAMQRVQQLNYAKQQAVQRPQPTAPQLDDMTMHYAKEFINENKWYDPQGRDEDSAIVMAIDQALVKDGFRSDTEEYWDELRRRAARRLPERFGEPAARTEREERTERKPRGGPAVGSGREHAPTSTRKEIYISPERKQALIDAGVWDDPVLRMKYVKRYAEYDRSNKA
jgi:hypothetical protein